MRHRRGPGPDLARPAADQGGRRRGVVRVAEGRRGHQRAARRQQAGHRVDLRDLERRLTYQAREQARQPFGQHGLARPGAAVHEQVMVAGRADLEGSARLVLAPDVDQVRRVRGAPHRHRGDGDHAAPPAARPAPARPAGRRGTAATSGRPAPRPRRPAPLRRRSAPARPPGSAPPGWPPRRRAGPREGRGPRRRGRVPRAGGARPPRPGATSPAAASTATAIAKSKPDPRFCRSAGESDTVRRRFGHVSPLLTSAARTLSRASDSAASGSPTR